MQKEKRKIKAVDVWCSLKKTQFQLLSDEQGKQNLPDVSGRKTSESESFTRKGGDGGIEKKIDARSDKNR